MMSLAVGSVHDSPGMKIVTEGPKTRHPRVLELDGVRGIAILFVLAHHLYLNWPGALGVFRIPAEYSWIGVDIFFALSGFLITEILLRSKPGVEALKEFYIKRALRIWPLYFLLLGAVCLEAHLFHKVYPWKISLLLLQNFLWAWPNLGFNQTWSLCIEEHFYFVWPLLIFFAPRKVLPAFLGFILLFSPILRHLAMVQGVSPKLLYTSTQYRLDPIAIGSLLAFCFASGWLTRLQAASLGRWVLPFALAGTLMTLRLNSTGLGQYSVVLYSLLALCSASILTIALDQRKSSLHSVLRFRPLVYVGDISYGLYMLHPFIFGIIARFKFPPAVEIPIALLLSFAIAAFSFHFVESQFQKLKKRLITH